MAKKTNFICVGALVASKETEITHKLKGIVGIIKKKGLLDVRRIYASRKLHQSNFHSNTKTELTG